MNLGRAKVLGKGLKIIKARGMKVLIKNEVSHTAALYQINAFGRQLPQF